MPLPLLQSRKTLGYAISHDTHIAYLTDTKGLPEETLGFLRSWGVDELILDCTHQPGDPAARNHNDLNMALDIVERVGAKHAWLTHIGHQMDCWLIDNLSRLPASVSIAQDNDAII
jgi:phosphoribosyl 1,2-cyclic phosphate phosphodiesterase